MNLDGIFTRSNLPASQDLITWSTKFMFRKLFNIAVYFLLKFLRNLRSLSICGTVNTYYRDQDMIRFTWTWRFPLGWIWYLPPVICSPSFLQVMMGSGFPLVIQVSSMSRPSATFSSFAGGTMIAGSSSADTITFKLHKMFTLLQLHNYDVYTFFFCYQKIFWRRLIFISFNFSIYVHLCMFTPECTSGKWIKTLTENVQIDIGKDIAVDVGGVTL